jgi:hypothetical protein
MIPSPPEPLSCINRKRFSPGTEFHRIHHLDFESNSFNPCRGRPSRFAPLLSAGACIPTMYAATSFEAAVHETIFHELQHDAARKVIAFGQIEKLDYAVIQLRRELVVASLFEADLNAWSLTRKLLIDTMAADYPETAKWAVAIHDAFADIDGLVWTSKRCDPDLSLVLFGDRVASGDIAAASRARIVQSNDLISQVRAFGQRANILLSL